MCSSITSRLFLNIKYTSRSQQVRYLKIIILVHITVSVVSVSNSVMSTSDEPEMSSLWQTPSWKPPQCPLFHVVVVTTHPFVLYCATQAAPPPPPPHRGTFDWYLLVRMLLHKDHLENGRREVVSTPPEELLALLPVLGKVRD